MQSFLSRRFYPQFNQRGLGLSGSFDQHQLWDCSVLLETTLLQGRDNWGITFDPITYQAVFLENLNPIRADQDSVLYQGVSKRLVLH